MSEETAIKAADEASYLSDWLENLDKFHDLPLKWLTKQHMEKFMLAVNANEAEKLAEFANNWHYRNNPSETKGLPLLAELNEHSDGFLLILAVAKFQPRWLARWFCWKTAEDTKEKSDLLNKTILPALELSRFRPLPARLSNEALLAIACHRPDFLELVSDDYLAEHITNILQESLPTCAPISALIAANALPEASHLFHAIIGNKQGNKALWQIAEFSKAWDQRFELNPLITAFVNGYAELDTLFRLTWANCINPAPRGEIWQVDFSYLGLPEIICAAIAAKPAAFELELGFSCGTRIASEKWEANIQTTRSVLDKFCPHKNADVGIAILPMTKLWALLAKLAEYERKSWQNKLELTGLHTELNQFTSTNPTLWASALPWLLPRMAELGQTVEAITYQLASTNSAVWDALAKLTRHDDEAIRLKARGLQSFFGDNPDANADFPRALADAAARYLDGTPMFPHPLTPLSATWLGAGDVETIITTGIARACSHFAQEVRDQGGDIEEALTKALIKELEHEFRDNQPRIQLAGKHLPILTVKQRPASKSKEEPIYGCDLAWLITGNVKGRFEAVWVDLVQVKKSLALQQSTSKLNKKTTRPDSWTIDSKQLDTILHWSQTATYWMIAAAGEVLVIPAKHLAAIRRGTGKLLPQKTFTVGYHEVRSAAIPLAQYLTELLIGQWLGTTSDTVIEFARGENTNCRPRMVIELSIIGSHKEGRLSAN